MFSVALFACFDPLLKVFEHAMTYTAGEDLAKILWLKSENSESWLQRRATYTRSLAVMSMVGYILGLGDRHPSNLMLDRKTGKIIHIDFGDCFEVAKHRDKFPEKVPFRLTRMLVNAMEVAGIEGNYRLTCEKVMTVLRENRDSLVATLEAFVHDPLISWRLMNINPKKVLKTELLKEPPVAAPPTQPNNEVKAPSTQQSRDLPALSLTETQKPFAGPRSLVAKSFLTMLEPIQEMPSEVIIGSARLGNDEENEEEPESEDSVMQRYNPRGIKPLTIQPPPQGSVTPTGFADHSAVNDIISTSFKKQSLIQQGEHHMLDLLTAATNPPNLNDKSASGKSVSFSHVNQTIDADNTIRKSSVSVAIVKQVEIVEETRASLTNTPAVTGGAANTPAAVTSPTSAMPTLQMPTSPSTSTNIPDNMGANLESTNNAIISSSVRASGGLHQTNIHLEMASLANSISQINPTRVLAMSARQSIGSVRSLLGAPSAISQLEGGDGDSQQELTDKAVIVIRRVMDKLTGMDFPTEHVVVPSALSPSSSHLPQQQQQALEVAEQVDRLIREAISNENLSQSFFGWCPFW